VNKNIVMIVVVLVVAVILVALALAVSVGHQTRSGEVRLVPVERKYASSYGEAELPPRRVISWSETTRTISKDVIVAQKAVCCRYEPSGEPCSLEEYNQLEGIGD